MNKKSDQLMIAIGWVALAIVVIRIFVTTFWYVYPYHVLTLNKPIKVTRKVFASGQGDLEYVLDYCKNNKYRELSSSVQYSFVNHIIQNTPATYGPLEPGCHVIVASIPMPELPPGKYFLQMHREYKVNPVKIIEVDSKSDEFEVVGN